jgi:branched-subunit amino acid aminotransferase/4-amino-4-deoxychorismate lyase
VAAHLSLHAVVTLGLMRHFATEQIEIDGSAPTAARLRALVLDGYGHFTAMQVRDRRVRGLDLHLARLTAASTELFGAGLDGGLVTGLIRHALGPETADASVRVYVQRPDPDQPLSIMVTVRPPGELPASMRLQSVAYQRSVSHIKHLGDFGQHYYGMRAERDGFDEALLTGQDGLISEGSVTNVGCFDGAAVVWPAAPMLAGITMQVLQRQLGQHGVPVRNVPVRVADLPGYDSVFVCNSRGIAPVTSVDGTPLAAGQEFMRRLGAIFQAAPWDQL